MLLNPFMEKLEQTDNAKDVDAIRNIFRKVVQGLLKNPTVQVMNMMIYINSLLTENMEIFDENREKEKNKKSGVENWGYTAI